MKDYVLINNKKQHKHINENDFIFIQTDKIILNEKNNEQVVVLDYNNFIKDILASYINDDDLYNQFKLDFYRTTFFINGFELKSHQHFIDFFKTILSNHKLKELLSICSQTGLASAYIIVQKTLFEKNINLIFFELVDKKKIEHKIKIKTYDNNININIHKKLRIVDLISDIPENLYNVDINLNLTFEKDKYVTITYYMEHIY